jgi:ribose/xylose/arabinose/galactoside ABC-type transport system permease subunit
MTTLRSRGGAEVGRHGGIVAALLLMVVVGTVGSSVFLTWSNMSILARQMAGTGVLAAGTTVLMISGGIDLSIGAAVSVESIILARWLNDSIPVPVAVVLVVALAAGIGVLMGGVIALTKAPPFMVTLGSLSIFHGIAIALTPGGPVGIHTAFTTLGVDRIGKVPIGFIVMVLVMVATYVLLHHLRVGRLAFAIGGNEVAARLSGIRVDVTKVGFYALNGALVGLGACIITSGVGAGGTDVGTGLELEVIAAVVIGGANLAGGEGSVFGSFLGVLLIGLITNALSLAGVGSYLQYIVFGAITVGAVALRSSGVGLRPSRWLRDARKRGKTSSLPMAYDSNRPQDDTLAPTPTQSGAHRG